MNKNLSKTNLTAVFFVFLSAGIFFSGCTQTTVVVNGNASVNNEPATANKNSAPPNSNVSASRSEEVLWDFRKVSGDKPQEFPKAETDAVLKYVVGDNWDKNLQIASRVSGAFTKANAKETLYYLSGCEDKKGNFVSNNNLDCGHVNWDSVGWLAIFDGTTPIVKIKKSVGNRIGKATDVNGDGISEIVSLGGYANMGIVSEGGSFGQISGDQYQEIKELSGMSSDCGSAFSKDKKAVASVVSYTPASGGKMPDLTEEYFQAKCEGDDIGKNPQWEKITKKQFDDFVAANS